MKTCKTIHKKRSQAKHKKRPYFIKSSRSQSGSGSQPSVTSTPVKLHFSASKARTTQRPAVENVTLLVGDGVSVTSEDNNRKTFDDISRELEPCDPPEKERDADEGERCDVSLCESSVSQNECLEFYEEVPHAHLLPYITPVFVTDEEMLFSDSSDNNNTLSEILSTSANSGSSQDIEDLDLATLISESNQNVDTCVSEKRTLDGLGIDGQQPGLNPEHHHVGRQCTGDKSGENQNESGAADAVTEHPESSSSGETTGEETPNEKATEEAYPANDSDMEDPSTEDPLQAVVKCRLCAEEFGRFDELALHVCRNHSPVVRIIRLTQVKFDLIKK